MLQGKLSGVVCVVQALFGELSPDVMVLTVLYSLAGEGEWGRWRRSMREGGRHVPFPPPASVELSDISPLVPTGLQAVGLQQASWCVHCSPRSAGEVLALFLSANFACILRGLLRV